MSSPFSFTLYPKKRELKKRISVKSPDQCKDALHFVKRGLHSVVGNQQKRFSRISKPSCFWWVMLLGSTAKQNSYINVKEMKHIFEYDISKNKLGIDHYRYGRFEMQYLEHTFQINCSQCVAARTDTIFKCFYHLIKMRRNYESTTCDDNIGRFQSRMFRSQLGGKSQNTM